MWLEHRKGVPTVPVHRKTFLLAPLLFLVTCSPAHASLGKYDPCTTPGLATLHQGVYIGLAFWPGYTPEDWGPFFNTSSGEFGLNPCNTTVGVGNVSDREFLSARGVVFAGFELKIDSMTAMQISGIDMDRLYNLSLAATTNQPVVSMVAFRAGFRTEARYVISDDAALSFGTGFVTSLAFAVTLSRGVLSALTWDDVGCNACGGLLDPRCIKTATTQPQHSCTLTPSDCSAYQNCSLAVFTGYTGSDRHGNTMTTATQIHQINRFSAQTLYNNVRSNVADILSGSGQTLLGGNSPSVRETSGAVA